MRTQGTQMNNISLDDMTERIKIMYREKQRNAKGDIIEGAEKLRGKSFAKIYPYMSRSTEGRELELKSEVNYRIIIRWRDDIKADDYIKWREKTLKMRSPPYDIENRRMYLMIEAQEELSDGK